MQAVPALRADSNHEEGNQKHAGLRNPRIVGRMRPRKRLRLPTRQRNRTRTRSAVPRMRDGRTPARRRGCGSQGAYEPGARGANFRRTSRELSKKGRGPCPAEPRGYERGNEGVANVGTGNKSPHDHHRDTRDAAEIVRAPRRLFHPAGQPHGKRVLGVLPSVQDGGTGAR